MDVFFEVGGKRTIAKAPEFLPRVGDTLLLTPYGRLRAGRFTVARIEWSVAQEESPNYFNRPKQCVLFLEANGGEETEG